MTRNAARRFKTRITTMAARRRAVGRHRFGLPGLVHCATRPAVQAKLTARATARPARLPGPVRLVTAASSVAATSTVAAFAWFTVAGAAVVARLVR